MSFLSKDDEFLAMHTSYDLPLYQNDQFIPIFVSRFIHLYFPFPWLFRFFCHRMSYRGFQLSSLVIRLIDIVFVHSLLTTPCNFIAMSLWYNSSEVFQFHSGL